MPPQMMRSLGLAFQPMPAGPVDTWDSDMRLVDEDVLEALGVANHYVFTTQSGVGHKVEKSRLVLDDVHAVLL